MRSNVARSESDRGAELNIFMKAIRMADLMPWRSKIGDSTA
jgi:hypothetical protein